MKNKLILLSFLITFKINSQISQKLLENGIKKCNQKNRIEALDDFNKLLNLNNSNKDAYFNRGKCEFEFKNFISAISDFNKTIKLDSNYVKAYYYRAKALINIGENELALLDIDKTIKLEPLNPKYFLNRGKIKIDIGYIEEAYEDFNFAKQLGDNKADIYLSQFCINDNENNEFFFLDWLQEGSWKIVDKIEKDKIKVLELIPLNETLKNWTKFGNMMLLKNTYSSSLEYSMNKIF
jgi:tetratricopeptide (TPR) repeat protein